MTNRPSGPGTARLIRGIDARLRELARASDKILSAFRRHSDAIRELSKGLSVIRNEADSLEKMKKVYVNNARAAKSERRPRMMSRDDVAVASDEDRRPGATDTVLGFMAAANGHRITRAEATKRLEDAINAGAVRTESKDALKMASTTIGNLIRTGYLRQEGEYVELLRTTRKRKGRPGTS